MSAEGFHLYVQLVDLSVVERAVRPHLAAPVTDVKQVPSGVNEVFLVSCADQQQVIARFNIASELARFQKEAWCIARAADVGVEGPTVLAVGTKDGHAFMIESFVAGRRGDMLAAEERPRMWRDIGWHMRRIHDIPVGGFGEELLDLTAVDGGAAWRRYITYNLSSLASADPLLDKGLLNRESQALLRETFARLAAAELRFGLSHGDPSPSNVIRGADAVLRVVDWGEAHAHVVPHYDLGVILNGGLDDQSAEFGALLDGYGWDATAYAVIRQEVMDLRLLIATDKVRWALARKPQRFADKAKTLKLLLRGASR